MKRAAMVVGVALFFVACGGPSATERQSERTYLVMMKDNRFDPKSFTVEQAETVSFRFVNRGRVTHDAFIGTKSDQKAHEREMHDADGGGHGGHTRSEVTAATVDPGDSKTLAYTFERRGTVLIGCHQAGHYEDGMVAKVKVL